MVTTTAKRIAMLALLLAVLAVPAPALAAPAAALEEEPPSRDERVAVAREVCRQLAEAGVLDQNGFTFGECVNFASGPASEQAANFDAGICGSEIFQRVTGTTTNGQCIQAAREIFSEQP